MKRIFFICAIFIVLDSCIDPFLVDVNDTDPTLVVEGMITDQPGPYEVKLSYTNDVNDQLNTIPHIQDASVVLFDDHGNSEALTETEPGVYQTSSTGIQGQVGYQYHIQITLSDNSIFESEPETLIPVGEIKDFYYEFEQKVDASVENFSEPANGFNIYIDSEVLPQQESMVRWRTTGIFELRTFPEKRIKYESGPKGGIAVVADPPLCSGHKLNGKTHQVEFTGECYCCTCWVTQYDSEPIISDPKFVNNGEVKKQFLRFIPASRRIFYNKYFIEVEQLSMSKKTYDFWRAVNKQRGTGSDLFQTPPPPALGNIVVVAGKQKAMGYFAASAIKTKSLFLGRELVPYFIPPTDTIPESCTVAYRYSTATKPPFW
jgi:hypothetical protein